MTADTRSCTCHPSEAPQPCQRKYALGDCRRALLDALAETDAELVMDIDTTAVKRRAALVEKVAIAIYQTWCAIHGVAETSLPWSEIDDEERDACVAEATAAIDLIRVEVLEEAALRAEDFLGEAWEGYEIAAAIRALK